MTTRTTDSVKPSALPEELLGVARTMSLLWSFRPRTAIFNLARLLGERRGDGRALTQEDVKSATRLLDERGALVGMPHRDGYYRLADDLRAPLYRELLETRRPEQLREALFQNDGYRPERGQHYYWPIHDRAATVGILRLALFSGVPAAEVKTMISAIGRSLDAGGILQEAVFEAFDGAIVERVVPELRWDLLFEAATTSCLAWRADLVPVCDWAIERFEAEGEAMPAHLRLALAECCIAGRLSMPPGCSPGSTPGPPTRCVRRCWPRPAVGRTRRRPSRRH